MECVKVNISLNKNSELNHFYLGISQGINSLAKLDKKFDPEY